MAVFFACAGYFFRVPNSIYEIKSNLIKKSKTLFIPLLVWGGLIGFFVENVRLIVRNMNEIDITSAIIGFVTGKKVYLASWFILVLIGVYIVEYLVSALIKNCKYKYAIMIILNLLLLPIGYCIKYFQFSAYYKLSLILVSCFFFMYGKVVSDIVGKLEDFHISYRIVISCCALVLGGILAFVNNMVTYSRQQYGNELIHTSSACLTIFGMVMAFKLMYNYKGMNKIKSF